jgi:hypothetical protein
MAKMTFNRPVIVETKSSKRRVPLVIRPAPFLKPEGVATALALAPVSETPAPAAPAPARNPIPAWKWLRRKIPALKLALPLVIGGGDAIRERAAAAGLDEADVKKALRLWFCSRQYREAVAAEGSQRHDIDGAAVEAVTDEHRQYAQMQLAWRKERQKADANAPQAKADGGANG